MVEDATSLKGTKRKIGLCAGQRTEVRSLRLSRSTYTHKLCFSTTRYTSCDRADEKKKLQVAQIDAMAAMTITYGNPVPIESKEMNTKNSRTNVKAE